MFRSLLVCLTAVLFFLCSKAEASTIVLQSGQRITGEIIDRTILHITVDVDGLPYTIYLGEIASIDGEKVELPEQPPVNTPTGAAKTPDIVYDKDEKGPLEKGAQEQTPKGTAAPVLKNTKPSSPKPAPTASASSAAPAAPHVQPAAATNKLDTAEVMNEMLEKISGSKNVIPTADGGIIVVGPKSITKYDKDLNVIKQIDVDQSAVPQDKNP